MIVLLLAVAVAIALSLLVLRAMKGPAHTVDSLAGPVHGLLRQGYAGGFLIIDVAGTNKFVQLSKYINSPDDYGIEIGFPRAGWSSDYYDRLRKLCDAEQVQYRVARAGEDDPLEFMFIDFGKDHIRATDFVRRVFTEVLDVPAEARFYTRLENATPNDELIES